MADSHSSLIPAFNVAPPTRRCLCRWSHPTGRASAASNPYFMTLAILFTLCTTPLKSITPKHNQDHVNADDAQLFYFGHPQFILKVLDRGGPIMEKRKFANFRHPLDTGIGQKRRYTNSPARSSICVNHPAIVREIPHFDVFPAFPHFSENVPHFWFYFEKHNFVIIVIILGARKKLCV